MAGAFVERLPPERGILTEQSPVKLLTRAVSELQNGAAAGLVCKIAGIKASARIRNNIIFLSGRVVTEGEGEREKYPDDGEYPGTDIEGGEWDESDSASSSASASASASASGSGGGPEPVVPFSGDVQMVKSVGVALSASGTRLTVTLSFLPVTMQFISGKLVSVDEGSAQEIVAHVDGESCGEEEV